MKWLRRVVGKNPFYRVMINKQVKYLKEKPPQYITGYASGYARLLDGGIEFYNERLLRATMSWYKHNNR